MKRNMQILSMKFSVEQQIKYGGIISYLLIGLNVILGLVYTPWILHEIGNSHYGLYTLAVSLISLFLMDFGMSAAITRFVSVYRAKDDTKKIGQFLSVVIKLYFLIMVMMAIVLIIVYFNINKIYSNLTIEELRLFRTVFILTAVCVVICFPVNVCNGILNAYEEYIQLKIVEMFNRLGTVVVTIVVLSYHGGLISLILVNECFNLCAFLLKIVIIKKNIPISLDLKYFNTKEMKEAFSFSMWTTVISVSQSMIFNIMPTILAMTLNTFAITLYGFANVIEGYVSTITGAINGMFLPQIARITFEEKDASNVLPLMIKVGRINQSIVMLIMIGIISLGREFIFLWVGEEYDDLYPCILLLAFPYLISASEQIASSSITALNKVKYSAIINMITGVFNLVVAYFVSKKMGVIGVCLVISLTFILRVIAENVIYKKILNIDLGSFFYECHVKLLPASVLSLVLSTIGIKIFDWQNGWLAFLLKVIYIVAIYFVCMWICGWNKFEKSLLRNFLS